MKKHARNNKASCRIEIFGITCYCYKTKEDYQNEMKYYGARDWDKELFLGVSNYLIHENGVRTAHIGVFEKDLGVLMHELIHVTREILKEVGIDCNSDCGNETQAYMAQFMFYEFKDFINDL